jgi:uncharacterized membrane protein
MGLLWSKGDDWMTSELSSSLPYWSRALIFAIAVILIALRLIILLRQPYRTKLEILGATSMILGCLVAIYFMATFCQ